jgi:hypothetical protein
MFASNNKGSLRQGEQFKTMQKMFNKAVKNIGKNNYIGIEGANGNDNDKTKMETLVDEFRRTLNNYKTAYGNHLNSSMSNNDVTKYYGNTIKAKDSDVIFYITTKGVMRKIGTGSGSAPGGNWGLTGQRGWDAKTSAHECPMITENNIVESSIIDNWEVEGEDLKYKERSEPLGEKTHYFQKCPPPVGGAPWANGGVFITKDGTAGGPLAWYDHKGKKHDFKDNVTRSDAHNSCPKRSGRTYRIPAIEFNNLMETTATKLDENTPCPNIIQAGENNITSLNNRLIDLAIEMKNEINSINQRSGDTDEASTEAKRNLDTLISEIKEQRKKIKKIKKEIHSLDTTITDNARLVKSINLRYIAWGISLVTIGLIGMHQLKN